MLASTACLFAFCSEPRSQTQLVLPQRATTSLDGYTFENCFAYSSGHSHLQTLYHLSELSAVYGKSLQSIALRRPTQLQNNNSATALALSIDVSLSPVVPSNASTTFANNHGSNKMRVFAGTLNLPATPYNGGNPSPFEAPIPFSQSFPMSVGRNDASFVLDTVCTANSAGQTWYVDSVRIGAGFMQNELAEPSCSNSIGQPSLSIMVPDLDQPYVGGTFGISFLNLPTNVSSLGASRCALGAQGVGGSWGGLTLPIVLNQYIANSPPGCKWANDYLVDMPMQYSPTAGTLTLSPFAIPNDGALTGSEFVVQGICTDTVNTRLSLFPTSAWRCKLGSGARIPHSTVKRLADTTPPATSGTRYDSLAMIVRGFFP